MRQKGWGMLQPSGEHAEKDGHAHVMSESATSGPASSSASISSRLAVTTPRTFRVQPPFPPLSGRGLRRGFSDLDLPVESRSTGRFS